MSFSDARIVEQCMQTCLMYNLNTDTFADTDKVSTTSKESNEINGGSNNWVSRAISESILDATDEPDREKVIERRSSHHSMTPSPDQSFGKKLPQYSSFRVMKQKVYKRCTQSVLP